MKTFSLRLKLTLTLLFLALLTWGIASSLAWYQSYKTINELFDTQQMAFAKRLSVLPSDLALTKPSLTKTKKLLRKNRGHQDDDALAFAVFTSKGEMVLNDGDNGRDIRFEFTREGFTDGLMAGSDDPWRFVWLKSQNGQYVIAVGQEWEYRQEMATDIMVAQFMPWLVALPAMLLIFLWLLTRALRPLNDVANQLYRRKPNELTPIQVARIPSEARPIIDSVNGLFGRINQMFMRERQFTSDAAHELRSPLAALRVQAEVVQIAGNNREIRQHAVENLTEGIDRATRLVDQLLTLSRLESSAQLEDISELTWENLIDTAVKDIEPQAMTYGTAIIQTIISQPKPFKGQALLLGVLLRNLLHNAIRYGKEKGEVKITLYSGHLEIEDNGEGVTSDVLQRLGERFYRPPGQEKTGSGLGLSIVKRIAELHNLHVMFTHAETGGFCVKIMW